MVAVIGPRQCGKSTFAKQFINDYSDFIYLDLEKPSDLRKIENAEWFLTSQKDKLICIDEIQRKPDLFPLIRSLVDEWQTNGKFLILGSASRDLLNQSSESLAGRISYKRLTPFLYSEIKNQADIESCLALGTFPKSILASSGKASYEWRQDFIRTFLERDLLLWSGFSSATMRRLWEMLAHTNGQLLNLSSLGSSLGVSHTTVRNYVELLKETFMVEILQPYHSNIGKRLVKSPKVYISDTGITSALLGLKSFEQLSGHPCFGSAWESFVIMNISGHFPEAKLFFYRTSQGAEMDIVLKLENQIFAIECKASYAPALTKGNYNAIEDILPEHTFVISPVIEGWAVKENVDVVNITELILKLTNSIN